jgi:hypothetical protein
VDLAADDAAVVPLARLALAVVDSERMLEFAELPVRPLVVAE